MKVLVAEDDQVNRLVAMRSLEKLGCEVVVATNGAEAVMRFMTGSDFDLVLMDIQMPIMDGFDATRRIRMAENGASHVPVVALTALDFPETKRKCAEAGMDGFAPKPLGFNTFMELLAEHVWPFRPQEEEEEPSAPELEADLAD